MKIIFSGNEKKNIMDGIVETNRQILNKKNSTIEGVLYSIVLVN